jgi:polyhydroxyalkanoate synthesis repressor PhaR
MTEGGTKEVLQIKKYPNRRFYDATRSQHVTLQEVYDLVVAGRDVVISDSKTGDDITNLVLTQILLEKDPPKLDLFPAWMLHQLIRSNRHVLRSTVDRFLGPFVNVFAATQRQFETYMRQAMRGEFVTPLDWASGMMRAMAPGSRPNGRAEGEMADLSDFEVPDESTTPGRAPQEVDELRRQISELTRRIEEMSTQSRPDAQS